MPTAWLGTRRTSHSEWRWQQERSAKCRLAGCFAATCPMGATLARPPHRAHHPNSTPLHYCITAQSTAQLRTKHSEKCRRSDGAKQKQQGCMGARHGRAPRRVSLFSNDSCDGMLPVRLLFLRVLQTGAGHRRMPRGERAFEYRPNSAPLYGSGCPRETPAVLRGAPPHIPRGCYQNRRTAAAWAGAGVQVIQLVQR